jgi:hypothetical protein
MVLDTALDAAADALVTFNRRDFSGPAERFGVELWRPGDLSQRLKVRR